jgi:hypothetical protein
VSATDASGAAEAGVSVSVDTQFVTVSERVIVSVVAPSSLVRVSVVTSVWSVHPGALSDDTALVVATDARVVKLIGPAVSATTAAIAIANELLMNPPPTASPA